MSRHADQQNEAHPSTNATVAMLAALMGLNSFAIDAMIPALPQIGHDLGVVAQNDRQLVVIAYMLGFGSTQLIWGPLADRFGRKPILAAGIILYSGFALLCALAGSFPMLIAARACQGASAAVTRVLIVAVIRDLFEAEEMARVMSLTFMVFMVMPVIAPSIGQLILFAAPWRAIFFALAAYGLVMLVWSSLKLPETLHPEYKRSLHWRDILRASWATIEEPQSRGYTIALTLVFGCLTAYIASIQQIVAEAFDAPGAIGIVFALVAAPMALASWANSRIVHRFGLRRVGHSGAAGFAAVTLVHALVGTAGGESLALFVGFQGLAMVGFAFCSANLSTLAMEHMGSIAGTASSVQGVVGTIGGALIGFAIGRAFDGTVHPFLWGFAIAAIAAFASVMLTEPKRLFERASGRPLAGPPEPPPEL
ncbi:MAG TPA: multidrug effflux MFS transporter [Sphingomicrobium sp.]|nr:multidrug effflux MFS transporter [Sphingomicrobium sp.]